MAGFQCAIACALLGLLPAVTDAQSTSNQQLSEILPKLLVPNIEGNAVIVLTVLDQVGIPITPSRVQVLAQQVNDSAVLALKINELVGNQLSTFPLGSSAGGFSWTFDPALGSFNRVTSSFGPSFAERALTVGRHRINLGVNYERVTFDKLVNEKLDGGVKLYTGVNCQMLDFPCDDAIYVQDSLNLKLSTDTVGIFATYGLTDRLDLGVAIPIVHVSLKARLDERTGSASGGVNPDVLFTQTQSGSASGIGDVTVRGKYNFLKAPGGGLAAGLDLRLPTGDELDLLGVAGLQSKIYVAGSIAQGPLSPHLNLGYTFSRASKAAKDPNSFVVAPSDEFNYAVGVDVATTPRLTIVGDVVGRSTWDVGTLFEDKTFAGPNFRQLFFSEGRADNVLGSVGFKFNPMAQSLFSVNLLFPLVNHGLADKVAWVAGFEISF